MAPRGTKRKSSAESEAIAKCAKVQGALGDALLKGMAKVALMTYKEKRHAYETDVIGEIGKALDVVAGSKSEAIAKLQVDVNAAPGEKQARVSALTDAEAKSSSLAEAVAAKKAELKAASEKTAEAQGEVKKVKEVQKKENKEFHRLATSIETLKEAETLLDAGNKKVLKMIAGFEGFDSSLVSALPTALKEDAASRSPFNQTTIDQFKAALKSCIEKTEGLQAAEKTGVDARAAAVVTAEEACTSAKAAEKELTTALEGLHEEEKEARKAVTAGKKKVSSYYPDMKTIMDSYDDAKVELTDFNTEVLGAFNELKERVEPPPEPEPVPEEAAPAAEEEAPAADAAPAA